jgi:light-regulated signal transduction histidine kinase (bacteriophytochrome)
MNDFRSSLTPEATELLDRIEEATIRMGKLIDGLLSLARLGRQSLNVRQNEINAIVDQAIAILQPECDGREVEWRIARLPTLACDAVLIAQVFQNLLDNALKYSRHCAKAVIEIDSIQRPGESVAIFVRDNGAGFNMKYAGRLFGAFQRLHTEDEFEGMGIGLATVHRIIQKHGGTLWAEAEVGRGATFYFTFAESEAAATAPKAATVG